MPNVNYVGVGRNGGQNADLEAEKIESLRLANGLARAKLAKLRGDVVDKRLVTFAVGNSWALLRERIMTLPGLVAAELRDLGYDRHGVKLRIEAAVSRFLCEVADSLERITSSEDFLVGFGDDDANAETDAAKDAAERKKTIVNAKRRAKRNAAKQ